MATSSTYAPPTPLHDLHILDVLELAGSQLRAGQALAMHQSTVCRSLRLMRQQFRLVPGQAPAVCRHGHNACLHHLRLAYREHRLMEGLLRLGTDGLHQPLLERLADVQLVPARFRSVQHWAELVRHSLLDGALVSSLGLESPPPRGQAPRWDGLEAEALGQLRLQLLACTADTRGVLLPRKGSTPALHAALSAQGFAVELQPPACQDPAAWVKRARDRRLALALCPQLVGSRWLANHNLVPLPQQPNLSERLWLLLPEGLASSPAGRQALRRLRAQISAAGRMGTGAPAS